MRYAIMENKPIILIITICVIGFIIHTTNGTCDKQLTDVLFKVFFAVIKHHRFAFATHKVFGINTVVLLWLLHSNQKQYEIAFGNTNPMTFRPIQVSLHDQTINHLLYERLHKWRESSYPSFLLNSMNSRRRNFEDTNWLPSFVWRKLPMPEDSWSGYSPILRQIKVRILLGSAL